MGSSSSAAAMAEAKAHVEKIRRERFFIGREERNPLAEDIHQAVSYLSEELYSKDVHFLMELVQNAEDNEYPLDVSPALEFVITEKDITITGAESTLRVFNNERGFSSANIESICRIGRSTKKGNRHLGYIGEKERLKDLRWLKTDIGFRAPHEVFLVDDDWKCLLSVVDKVPLLDLEFYGDEIKLYKEELIFGVKRYPTVSDYCKLWSMWQGSNSALTQNDCGAFWEFFGKNWTTDMDDLLLEDLFRQQAQQPLFVWYPSASLTCLSPSKINDIYSSTGVQKISKAVARNESEHLKMEYVNIIHTSTVIKPGLLRVVLAFLADPIVDISAEKRHEMVSGLINVVVYETSTPLTVSYQVGLSSGRSMIVTSVGYFRWERENSRLFVTKTDVPGSMTNVKKMEYAACFAEEISKGLLFENAEQV
nr:unnamed protein product [Digitaria exilis]